MKTLNTTTKIGFRDLSKTKDLLKLYSYETSEDTRKKLIAIIEADKIDKKIENFYDKENTTYNLSKFIEGKPILTYFEEGLQKAKDYPEIINCIKSSIKKRKNNNFCKNIDIATFIFNYTDQINNLFSLNAEYKLKSKNKKTIEELNVEEFYLQTIQEWKIEFIGENNRKYSVIFTQNELDNYTDFKQFKNSVKEKIKSMTIETFLKNDFYNTNTKQFLINKNKYTKAEKIQEIFNEYLDIEEMYKSLYERIDYFEE